MVKPVHARMPADERRVQLLDAAVDLFSRKGFGGTTTKEIAAAAGVNEAVIFRHFATKQQLYTAILDHRLQKAGKTEWLATTKECMERGDDEGLFRAIAKIIIHAHRADPKFERLMLYSGLEGHELASMHHRQMSLPIFDMLRQYVRRRQRDGALRQCDPGLIIVAIAGMAQHYAMMTEIFGLREITASDDDVVETFTCIVLDGVRIKSRKTATVKKKAAKKR